MQKFKNILAPANFYLLMFLVGLILTLIEERYASLNYLLAAGIGALLGIITFLIEYKRNHVKPDASGSKVSKLPSYILYAILMLGIFWPRPQDVFFLALTSMYSLAIWIGLLVTRRNHDVQQGAPRN